MRPAVESVRVLVRGVRLHPKRILWHMATIEYLHVCDSAFMAEGGKQCIIGIFDSIYAPSFPVVHPAMTVAMRVRGQAHEAVTLRLELARPNGDILATVPMNMTLNDQGSQFVNLNMVGPQFPEQGRYIVKVFDGRQTLVSHSLTVHQVQAPPDPGTQTPPQIRH